LAKRIAALAFIFLCTSVAWIVLGATIFGRTYEWGGRLKSDVASLWGTPQAQSPPTASYEKLEESKTETDIGGRKVVRTETVRNRITLPLESSRISVNLNLDYRQKGLLWYSTYVVDFAGVYKFRNTSAAAQWVTFGLKFPVEGAKYDGMEMEVNGRTLVLEGDRREALARAAVAAGETAVFRVAYRSQGLDTWRYKLGEGAVQARDFALTMKTNFQDIDFAADTLSPSEKLRSGPGWELVWRYKSLVSGVQIGMTMPEKLQPGPLAGQISYFAPVSLFLFFFLMFIITTLRNIELHPMNYFFLAAAFFAFHLLLAYLVDHISIHLAFVISSVVSVFLVVSYLRLAVGMRFAAVEAATAQVIYLVLFSYAFFFKGFTGLAVTIGCIVTLFVVMQMTGRIRWAEKFGGRNWGAEPAAR
jgi:hypothetical protein